MRQWCLPVLILALAACSREPAPWKPATSALPPPRGLDVAQAAPAASVAPPAQAAEVAAASAPTAALKAPRTDPRWRDVDPSELESTTKVDPALAKFQEEQKRRDAELMEQDAQAAQEHLQRGGDEGGDDRYARDDDRYGREDDRYAQEEDRYAREDDRYADDRYRGDGRYGDDPYAARRASRARERAQAYGDRRDEGYDDEYPPRDDLDPYAQPQPWEEDPAFDPEAGEYYDPRYDDPYER